LLLTLLSAGQGTAVSGADIGRAIERLLPALGAYAASELVYWSEDELYEYANDALKTLAVISGMFAERDGSITVNAGTAQYTLPDRHLFTVHAALNDTPLRPASVQDLESLSDAWETDSGPAQKYVQNFSGVDLVRLYPTPTNSGTLYLVERTYPSQVSQASSVLSAPQVIEDYVWWALLRRAHMKESDGAMPEVAAFAVQPIEWMEKMFRHYWGAQ